MAANLGLSVRPDWKTLQILFAGVACSLGLGAACSAQRGPARLLIAPANVSMAAGASQTFIAYAPGFFRSEGKIGKPISVTWSSSNTNVAVIDQVGGITTKGLGITIITARHGPFQGSTVLLVGLTSITVLPSNPTIAFGSVQQFQAMGNFGANSQDITSYVSWNSSNTTVATISLQGLASSNLQGGSGTTAISATFGTVSGFTTLTVSSPPPPAAPANLTATAGNGQVLLNWNASAGATSYNILRSTADGGPYVALANGITVTSYLDRAVSNGTAYFYVATATNAGGISGLSHQATATPLAGGLNIPTAHPRLWFSDAATLSRAKSWYTSNGNSVGWSDPLFPQSLSAMRSVLSDTASYCAAPIQWLMNTTCFRPSDGNPSCSNEIDYARWNGEEINLIYDWCHDQMTPAQREAIISEYNPRYAELNVPDTWGDKAPANNYFWGFMRNSLEWGIATYGENPQAQSFIDDAIQRRYESQFLPFAAVAGPNAFAPAGALGGVTPEGTAYGRYQLQYPTVPFVSAGLMGKPLYAETNFFKENVYYLIYTTTPAPTGLSTLPGLSNQVFGFNDDDTWEKDGSSAMSEYYGQFMNVAANLWGDVDTGRYARHFLNTVKPNVPNIALAVDQPAGEKDYSSLPLDYYGSGMGYLFTRNQWGPNATSALIQMNLEPGIGGHFHTADHGAFQIWRGSTVGNVPSGQWLSRGTINYGGSVTGFKGAGRDFVDQALGGNTLIFEGLGSMTSPPPVAYANGPAVVQRVESRASYSYAAVDLSNLYRANGATGGTRSTYVDENYYCLGLNGASAAPNYVRLRDDNPHAKSVVREFLFIKPLETLVIFDRMESTAYDRQDVPPYQTVLRNPDCSGTATPISLPISVQVNDAAKVRKAFLLHFEQRPAAETQTVTLNGNQVSIPGYVGVNGNSALRVTTLVPRPANPVVVNSQVVDERDGTNDNAPGAQFRLEVTQSGAAQSYFLHVLQARDATGANLSIALQEDTATYKVTLTDPSTGKVAVVIFQKGMTSTGGSFGYAPSGTPVTSPLIDHIQGFQVTDSGPVWSAN